jgi:hypothetical protein
MMLLCAIFMAASIGAATASGAESLVLHVASIEQQQGDLAQAALPAGIGYHASVSDARDALRALQPLPPGGATVLLHEGTHSPFELVGEIDSGRPDAPIVYAGAPGERAVISGAVNIPASTFKPWRADRKGIVVADLAVLGITSVDLGSMQYPTSEGNMNFGSCQHDKSELFFGGDAMTLARYPNLAADGSWRFLYADRAAEFGPGSPGGPTQGGGAWWLMKAGANATKIQTWATEDQASSWLHGASVALPSSGGCTQADSVRMRQATGNSTGQIPTGSCRRSLQ